TEVLTAFAGVEDDRGRCLLASGAAQSAARADGALAVFGGGDVDRGLDVAPAVLGLVEGDLAADGGGFDQVIESDADEADGRGGGGVGELAGGGVDLVADVGGRGERLRAGDGAEV